MFLNLKTCRLGAFVALIFLSSFGGAAAQPESIALGAVPATSSHYAIAVAMSQAIEEENPEWNVSVVETQASVDNVRRLIRGEVHLGVVTLDTALAAVEGKTPFTEPVGDLVGLYAYDVSILNVAVRADTGITSIEDLDDRALNAGIRGSGAEVLTRGAFSLLGIEPEWAPGSLTDAVEAIRNRQIVGYSKYGPGTGIDATLREIITSTEMRLLGFTKEQITTIQDSIKGVGFTTVPAGIIPGQKEVQAPAVPMVYSTRLDLMSDETAYQIAKSIYKHRDVLVKTWPHLAEFDFANWTLRAEELGLNLHPGAKRFWESVQ